MMIKVQMTYDTVTPESVVDGDFEDHGFAEPGGWRHSIADDIFESLVRDIGHKQAVEQMTPEPEEFSKIDEVVEFISDYGPMEPSSSRFHNGIWYTQVEGSENTRLSFHIKASARDQYKIWSALKRSSD
jgi:hypothetical protein